MEDLEFTKAPAAAGIASTAPVKNKGGRPPKAATAQKAQVPAAMRTDAAIPARSAVRRRNRGLSEDRFALPPGTIPDGSSYEWKTFSVLGKEDPFYIQGLRENGWEPVDASRHPTLVPQGYKGSIIKDGQILMERPKELTDEATAELQGMASRQMASRANALKETPDGTLERRVLSHRSSFEKPSMAIDG